MNDAEHNLSDFKRRRDPITNHKREVLVVLVEVISVTESYCRFVQHLSRIPGRLRELGTLLVGMSNAKAAAGSGFQTTSLGLPKLDAGTKFRFFDWGPDELPETLPIASTPRPGVLFVIFGAINDEESVHKALSYSKLRLGADPRMVQYLASYSASVQPEHVPEVDVFISYSTKDTALAKELSNLLEERAIRTFLAEKSLGIGLRWQGQIQQALRESRMIVLLLTPESVESKWVMLEAGAAWALDIPLVPVLAYVKPTDLPAPISDFQCRGFMTTQEKTSLVVDIEAKLVKDDGPLSR